MFQVGREESCVVMTRFQLYVLSLATRPVWFGCDGKLRIGHTDDMVQMLVDLGMEICA